jgi:hypothetical protein
MELMTIEILNSNAIAFLRGLEKLNAIRLLPTIKKKNSTKTRLSQKYRGAISPELGNQLKNYIQQSRDEWQELTF